MAVINNRFVHFTTKAEFENQNSAGNILPESIVYIDETKEIYTHGQFFNGIDYKELIDSKVDKEDGKELSSNDFTSEEKTKLSGLPNNTYSESDIDNLLNDKVDKISGKGLSTNDYTTSEKNKLNNLPSEVYDKNYINTLVSTVDTKINSKLPIDSFNQWSINVAMQDDIPIKVSELENDSNYLTSNIAEDTYQLKGNYLTEHQDISHKANIIDLSNVLAHHVVDKPLVQEIETITREELKKDLFDDLWKQCYDCQVDHSKTKPYTCNGVELTYQEAIDVYNAPRISFPRPTGVSGTVNALVKTLIFKDTVGSYRTHDITDLIRGTNIETIRLVHTDSYSVFISNMNCAFQGCAYLTKIIGILNLGNIGNQTNNNAFTNSPNLKEIRLLRLCTNLTLQWQQNISYNSLNYLITESGNVNPITITVHPNVYAKIIGDITNSSFTSLTEEDKTKWQQLLTDATAKKISFATI